MTKKTEPTFWLRDNCYFMLTGEIWQGLVYVALMGDTPDKVTERAVSMLNISATAKQVEPWAVPLEWWRAFHALCDRIPANPPSRPVRTHKTPSPVAQVEEEDAEVEEELLMHVAAGTDMFTAGLAAAESFREKAYAPINEPCPLSFVSGIIFIVVILAFIFMVCQ